MRARSLFLSLSSVLLFAALAPLAAAEYETTPVGLSVVDKPRDDGGRSLPILPFGAYPGTNVAFMLRSRQRGLSSLSPDNCKITKATDDLGTDLLAGYDPAEDPYASSFPPIRQAWASEDGGLSMIELRVPGRPALGAKQITISGHVTAFAGGSNRTALVTLNAEVGARIDVLGRSWRVQSLEPSDWVENGKEVQLAVDGTAVQVQFLFPVDGAGNPRDDIELIAHAETPEAIPTLVLPAGETSFSVQVVYQEGAKPTVIPFDLQIDLGLAPAPAPKQAQADPGTEF